MHPGGSPGALGIDEAAGGRVAGSGQAQVGHLGVHPVVVLVGKDVVRFYVTVTIAAIVDVAKGVSDAVCKCHLAVDVDELIVGPAHADSNRK